MTSRFVSLVAVAMFALPLAACNSSQGTASDTKGSAATPVTGAGDTAQKPGSPQKALCVLLPKEDMEAILGGPLTNVTAKESTGKTQCTYVGFGRYADVAIEWKNGEAGMAGARLAAKFMGATAGPVQVMTPIADLGDEAVMMIGGVLSVRKGEDLITVDLRTNKNAEVVGPTIARKIIEQL